MHFDKKFRGKNAPPPRFRHRQVTLACWLTAVLLIMTLGLGAPATAHDSNCDNTTAGSPIHCEKASSSNDAIDIDVSGVSITTTGGSTNAIGIKAKHSGGTAAMNADITIDVDGTSTISTTRAATNPSDPETDKSLAHGIHGQHEGIGDLSIDVEDTTITITGAQAGGILGQHSGSGNIDIDATAATISTTGTATVGVSGAEGIFAAHTGTGDITVNIQGKEVTDETTMMTTTTASTITTTGPWAHGVSAQQSPGTGKTGGGIAITLEDTQITTGGSSAAGIHGRNQSSSSGALTATLNSGTTIRTTGAGAHGVHLTHENIDTTATGNDATLTADGITVTTTGAQSYGLWANKIIGRGDVTIAVTDSTITTENTGDDSIGIYGYKGSADGDGDIDIDVTGGSTTTKGSLAFGVYAHHQDGDNRISSGDITIDLLGHTLRTEGTTQNIRIPSVSGTYSYGIYAVHRNTGDIVINLKDHPTSGDSSSVTTLGKNSHGIVAYHYGTAATGRMIDITVGSPVTVSGAEAQGVRIGTVRNGAAERIAALDANGYRDQTVTVNAPISSQGPGIYLANGGKVVIDRTGDRMGSIDSASGIAILATGDVSSAKPKLHVNLKLDGDRVHQAISQDDWILNDGGATTLAVNDVVLHDGATGFTRRAVPNGAWNVWIRSEGVRVTDRSDSNPANWVVSDPAAGVIADRDFSFSTSEGDFVERDINEALPIFTPPPPPTPPPSPAPPPPAPAPEAMQVNVPVVAEANAPAAVVVMEESATVVIGPQGSLAAASGIAILATADPEDPAAAPPQLTVDMALDGRQVGQVLGDDWILNDGGGTTIVINGVKLHDGTTGVVPGASAPNGAFNVRTQHAEVRIREEGVRVLDRSNPDPANWVLSEPMEGVIADRDFSAADFVRVEDGMEVQPPMLIEEYAPRAALYEVLPDLLLRLGTAGIAVAPSAPAGVQVTGHHGSHRFDHSTVGARYDLDAIRIEAGKPLPWGETLEGRVSAHYLNGTAEVSSPVQGGDIDVQGLGLSLQLCRGCTEGDGYVSGQLSLSRYDLDLDSDTRGRLKSGVHATAQALRLEAGRRLQRETVQLTPRVRLDWANVSVDRFTDAVDARISYSDETRLTGTLGVLAETGRSGTQGKYTLWGSLDLETRLDGTQTVARVSGERLAARAGDHSVLLGVGGAWTWGPLNLDASLHAREELDTSSEDYTAALNLQLPF